VPFVKPWTIGRSEYVASAGASSMSVQMIVEVFVVISSVLGFSWLVTSDTEGRSRAGGF
jgi:hypothetical protein